MHKNGVWGDEIEMLEEHLCATFELYPLQMTTIVVIEIRLHVISWCNSF